MESKLFQGGALMHSYLRAVGFSRITKRSSIRQIITDVVETYDEKTVIENYPDGMFAEFSKNYGCDCGITVCGQYDENNVFYPDYYFPFFRGTGITTQESVVIERHADKESFAGVCDDLRIGVTLIFYLQNAAEYLQQHEKGNILPGGQPLTLSGLAREGKILFPVEKDKEAVKAERELTKNRNHLIAAARNGDEEAMESLTMEDMDTYSMSSQRIVTDDIFFFLFSFLHNIWFLHNYFYHTIFSLFLQVFYSNILIENLQNVPPAKTIFRKMLCSVLAHPHTMPITSTGKDECTRSLFFPEIDYKTGTRQ